MSLGLVYAAGAVSVLTLGYVGYLIVRLRGFDEGEERIRQLSSYVREGAEAFLRRQYLVVAIFLLALFVLLMLMSFGGLLSFWAPWAFLTAGAFSGLAGYLGMKIATASNGRTTTAAKQSLNRALRVAFEAGSVMGFSVVGLGLLYITIWFVILYGVGVGLQEIAQVLLTSAMGASSVALFARVGGGIFTKSADVGADLSGKVEAGIPEDDPRNPAVVADQVGDNVGDVAGMGADLYESYVGAIIAAVALGISAFVGKELVLQSVAYPMLIAAVGIICSILGSFLVQAREDASQGELLRALRRGVYASALLIALIALPITVLLFGSWSYWGLYVALVLGLAAGIVIGFSAEYYTSSQYQPTRQISATAQTSPATVIISGLATGMRSTAIPVISIGIAIIAGYWAASTASAALPGLDPVQIGLYGIGIAAVGMLSTLGITLASDAYGPVADNAGGIAEMSHQKPEVRKRTDALDALGNTNAAVGKGFAIGSAALTAMALISNYRDQIALQLSDLGGKAVTLLTKRSLDLAQLDQVFSLSNPYVLLGLFVGAMLPFLFCAMTMSSVGRAAGAIVEEVRRQFREIPGLLEGRAKADYSKAVEIATRTAHREMIMPALLAIISPLIVGILFGVMAVMGVLVGALISGFVLALLMANSGGAWDNAKKYIEEGHHGGKGSSAHKAAVVGDTVGDPFKDTSGPSLNILIKLMSMVALVFVGLVLRFTLF
ncbi:MAG: sodium-translocating pyrophosphatase [Candidatus Bipolaricaulota bacterium]|nr:sodium-translocating pyrophosphatase [Candidatus Bipolaricaulota bacterium]MDW8031826.1 sodium-translocating pyrophosphatase [Candidatus Bipolaricaulota bacterium]